MSKSCSLDPYPGVVGDRVISKDIVILPFNNAEQNGHLRISYLYNSPTTLKK